MYKAILFSYNGSYTTDFKGCKSTKEVWHNINNAKSAMKYFPIACVIKDRGSRFNEGERIIQAPDDFKWFRGLSVAEVRVILENDHRDGLSWE